MRSVEQIAAEIAGLGPLEHVIWLAPETRTSAVADESCLAEQARGVFLVFRLVKALLSLGYGDRDVSWTLVTVAAVPVSFRNSVSR